MGFAEFDRQVRNLVDLGYPVLAGISEQDFVDLVAPLRALAPDGEATAEGRAPFLLVVTRALVPVERCMPLTALRKDQARHRRPDV